MIKFTIPGKPQGKGRPRVTRNGTYTPQKTKDYERLVQHSFMAAKCHSLVGELKASIMCYYPIPKNTNKKRLAMMQSKIILPTVKPDLDNVAKAVLDALNGFAYKDDNQIVELSINKVYSDNPRVEVEIKEINFE